MYLELGETKVLGTTVVSGTGNLDDACTWYTNTDEINPVNMYTGQVTGQQRAATVVPVGKLINETRYLVEINLICRETIYVKNYYDSTVDSALLDQIDDAVDFLNKVYNEDFFLYFEMDGLPQSYGRAGVDICPYGSGAACKSSIIPSQDCGTICMNHHKNVIRIATEAYDNLWERNHIIVLWSDCEYTGVYCTGMDGSDHLTLTGIAVTIRPDTSSDRLPIVQMIKNHDSNFSHVIKEYISITLAHEVAHTLGLGEIYNDSYGDNITDHKSSDGTCCIMAKLHADELINIYTNEQPLCDYCTQKLQNVEIHNDVYEATP